MLSDQTQDAQMRAVQAGGTFDPNSGNWLERLVFNHRGWMLLVCVTLTIVLGWLAISRITLNASFERMLPQSHAYIRNYIANRDELRGLGNSLRIVVENPKGDIFDPIYLETLRKINDEVFLIRGVDRAWMKSLWTPAVRWTEVTEEGYQGGEVLPSSYNGSPEAIAQVRRNVVRAGIVGNLVANDFRSSALFVPLLDRDPETGKEPDYRRLSHDLETLVREKYGSRGAVKIYIVGFAKVTGDLLDGLHLVSLYFLAAAIIAAAILFAYTRCWRSTALVLLCSLVAVIWQLGVISPLGITLNPYSILVPFLVFAIGVSHGAQKMNGIMQDIGRGIPKLVAARFTFRRLFAAGLMALLADAVGFAVLMVIDIPAIRDLALSASVGVAMLIVTNLLLLPVLLSYTGVSAKAAQRSIAAEASMQANGSARGLSKLWHGLALFTGRRFATFAILIAAALGVGGFVISTRLQVGDLEPGAPELRADSRYNRDNAFITSHYSLSSDQFAVIVKTPPQACVYYDALSAADRLGWALRQVPGVQTTASLADAVRQITAGSYEGSPKWLTLSRNQEVLNYGGHMASVNTPDLFNTECSVMPVIAYLADHEAQTLERVAAVASQFAAQYSVPDRQILLAAGNAGIEAATNDVVKDASRAMLLYVYAAVALLCLLTFRSWRATVVALVPLMLTSILCEALMVVLGIGVKVATLPVIALGVGIGVDYALYLVSVMLGHLRSGKGLAESYRLALGFTGKVVALVGATLAAGVVTWAWSPIKFQADMGILLTFMFLWNMVGALVLIPALSSFLLRGRATASEAEVDVSKEALQSFDAAA